MLCSYLSSLCDWDPRLRDEDCAVDENTGQSLLAAPRSSYDLLSQQHHLSQHVF